MLVEKKYCTGCGACAQSCPKSCIAMVHDAEGFLYPHIDESKCIKCKLCQNACPLLPLKQNDLPSVSACYAASAKDQNNLLHSSSGGTFSLLASSIIQNGGVVFGAAFDQDFNVVHKYAESMEELSDFRGSKYVQSRVGEAYSQAKRFLLQQNRPVLFTGTPCQINGLKSFLGREYENLYTQDIVCHSVPSPLVWERYKEALKQQFQSEITSLSFRDKKKGWLNYALVIQFKNGRVYRCKGGEDPYMQGFLKGLYSRPSCYHCAFKADNRASDITLADFWGVRELYPEAFQPNGTSLVLIHTPRGEELFHAVSEKINCIAVEREKAVIYNPAAIECIPMPVNRKKFWKRIHQKELSGLIQKCCKPTLWEKCKYGIMQCFCVVFRKR